MEILEMLSTALGIAALSGINLYLTVFVAGLAIRFGWITLSPQLEQLHVLGDPVILVIAGILYFMEFFADKVPWVDSLWDSLHTLIRPVGAALLAVAALGSPSPVFDVAVALLAGGVAASVHAAKAGVRLALNASPEPFSNIALSLGEDGFVVGALAVLAWQPLIGFVLLLLVVIVVWFFLPRLLRAIALTLWLAWRKFQAPATDPTNPQLPCHLPEAPARELARIAGENHALSWVAPVYIRSLPSFPRGVRGWLVSTKDDREKLHVVHKGLFGSKVATIPLPREATVALHLGFLSDTLRITGNGKRPVEFLFDRPNRWMAEAVTRRLSLRPASELITNP